MPSPPPRNVLITGCSDGSLGSALALAFHSRGLQVYATAREPSNLTRCKAAGITCLTLDVLSATSIHAAAAAIPSGKLDILINNAAMTYGSAVSDITLPSAKKLFDTNVWAYIEVVQIFLPLLLKSEHPDGAIIVNNSSAASIFTMPFQGAYNASKAAVMAFTDTLRVEMALFGIRVVDLKTAQVQSLWWTKVERNEREAGVERIAPAGEDGDAVARDTRVRLTDKSIWYPARGIVERALTFVAFAGQGTPADKWAQEVVGKVLRKSPPVRIWAGNAASVVWASWLFPAGSLDWFLRQAVGLDKAWGLLGKGRLAKK